MTWRAFIGGALFLVPEQVAVKHCTRPSRIVHPISVGAGRVWLARLCKVLDEIILNTNS